jgi:hypothetical protein
MQYEWRFHLVRDTVDHERLELELQRLRHGIGFEPGVVRALAPGGTNVACFVRDDVQQ